MRILIDIGHPGHVHLFKNFANSMITRGHRVVFTMRDKEFEIQLLQYYNFDYKCIGKHFRSKPGKIFGLLWFTIQITFISLRFKPDIYLSHGSIYAAISSWLLRKPHISFEDTFNNEQVRLYLPFTNCILTGDYNHPDLGAKQIKYAGYHELAYLHPNYFQADIFVKKKLNISENKKYFIVRFVSWAASHDISQYGLTLEQKRAIVTLLSKNGKVFISSENKLPEEFVKYKFPLAPEEMHNALAFSQLYVGESATMASECVMLGINAIYVDSRLRPYTIQQQEEEYGLVYNFRDGEKAIQKIYELLNRPNLKERSIQKSKRLLKQKIDVTSYLIWFIENYPKSHKIMRENPNYQYRFK